MRDHGYPSLFDIKLAFSTTDKLRNNYIDVATKSSLHDVSIEYLQLIKRSEMKSAEHLLNIAAARGSTYAMIRLAALERDSGRKFAWLAMATDSGDYAAKRALKNLKIDLSSGFGPNLPDKSMSTLESMTSFQRRLREIRGAFALPTSIQSNLRPEMLLMNIKDEDFIEVFD
jgi:hypothetical protein